MSPQVPQPLFLTRQTPCSALPKHHPFHTPRPLQLHMYQLQQLLGSVVFSPDTVAVLPTVISTVTTAPGTCLPATARPGWLDSPLGPSPAHKSLRNRLHQFPGLMAGVHGAWGTRTPRKILDQRNKCRGRTTPWARMGHEEDHQPSAPGSPGRRNRVISKGTEPAPQAGRQV